MIIFFTKFGYFTGGKRQFPSWYFFYFETLPLLSLILLPSPSSLSPPPCITVSPAYPNLISMLPSPCYFPLPDFEVQILWLDKSLLALLIMSCSIFLTMKDPLKISKIWNIVRAKTMHVNFQVFELLMGCIFFWPVDI